MEGFESWESELGRFVTPKTLRFKIWKPSRFKEKCVECCMRNTMSRWCMFINYSDIRLFEYFFEIWWRFSPIITTCRAPRNTETSHIAMGERTVSVKELSFALVVVVVVAGVKWNIKMKAWNSFSCSPALMGRLRMWWSEKDIKFTRACQKVRQCHPTSRRLGSGPVGGKTAPHKQQQKA